jgi:hypothetical protein
MKLKSVVAMAAVGAFTWSAGANANWFGDKFGNWFHGDKRAASSSMWNGYEVRTPSSVNEAAPWLANEPHMAASMGYNTASVSGYGFGSDSYATGASSTTTGFGSGGFDSTHMSYGSGGYGSTSHSASGRGGFFSKHMSYSTDMSFGNPAGTPYWLGD